MGHTTNNWTFWISPDLCNLHEERTIIAPTPHSFVSLAARRNKEVLFSSKEMEFPNATRTRYPHTVLLHLNNRNERLFLNERNAQKDYVDVIGSRSEQSRGFWFYLAQNATTNERDANTEQRRQRASGTRSGAHREQRVWSGAECHSNWTWRRRWEREKCATASAVAGFLYSTLDRRLDCWFCVRCFTVCFVSECVCVRWLLYEMNSTYIHTQEFKRTRRRPRTRIEEYPYTYMLLVYATHLSESIRRARARFARVVSFQTTTYTCTHLTT